MYKAVLFAVVVLACSLVTVHGRAVADSNDEDFFNKYFMGCPKCDLKKCPLLDNCEVVEGPGSCPCCPVCARTQGQRCGVYEPYCAKGLTCQPLPTAENNLMLAYLEGNAICIADRDNESWYP